MAAIGPRLVVLVSNVKMEEPNSPKKIKAEVEAPVLKGAKPRAAKEKLVATIGSQDAMPSSLFFPQLLATRVALEREARSSRISNLSIV